MNKCKQPTCNRVAVCKALCGTHYYRLTKGNDMDAPIKTPRGFRPTIYKEDPKLSKADFAKLVEAQDGKCCRCQLPTPVAELSIAHRPNCYSTVHHVTNDITRPFHKGGFCAWGLMCASCKYWWDS